MPSFRNLRGEPVEETVDSRGPTAAPAAPVVQAEDVTAVRARARQLREAREGKAGPSVVVPPPSGPAEPPAESAEIALQHVLAEALALREHLGEIDARLSTVAAAATAALGRVRQDAVRLKRLDALETALQAVTSALPPVVPLRDESPG